MVFFVFFFFKLWQNIHNIMFTILIMHKYTTRWHSHSQYIHNVMEPSPPFIPQTFSSSTTKTLTYRQRLYLSVCFLIRDSAYTWLFSGLGLVADPTCMPGLLRNASQDCPGSCNIISLDSWYWLPLCSCPFWKGPYRYWLLKGVLPKHQEFRTLSVPPLGADLPSGHNPDNLHPL